MDKNLTPLECYYRDINQQGFNNDPAQKIAVEHTQRLYDQLNKTVTTQNQDPSIFRSLFRRKKTTNNSCVKGLYFWGGVGRGKTYLLDNFFNCLPLLEKDRIHFHRFMQSVHRELKSVKNTQDPLKIVANQIAGNVKVICLDEFHVSDITDAMLLGKLLQALFDNGVCLLATSNEHPDQLYMGGLQRERFLPAIELLKTNTEIVNVDNGIDYRFRVLEKAEIYHSPLDELSAEKLSTYFEQLSPESGTVGQEIEIEGRLIKTIKVADSIAWFDFTALCDGPRGAADYIEIARMYQTVLLSNVPVMEVNKDDQARRFITMIDEFYDRNVKLIITAEVKPECLYSGKRLAQSFKRTVSRLQEMGTKEYLARQHIAE